MNLHNNLCLLIERNRSFLKHRLFPEIKPSSLPKYISLRKKDDKVK